MASKASVLLLEDDASMADIVQKLLTTEGYQIRHAKTIFQAKGMVAKSAPDLFILDRKLPDGDSLDFCKELRENENTKNVPILFLTEKKSVTEKVLGLRLGADDYLPKPFQAEELVARAEAILRRTKGLAPDAAALNAEELEINLQSRKAYLKKKELDLRPKEFDLLETLLRRRNRVLTRKFLLENVWGYDEAANLSTKVVDVTVGNLREKLGNWGDKITAVRGYGYQLEIKD